VHLFGFLIRIRSKYGNIKITFINERTFYLTYKMLKFTIETSIYLPLHVSVHLDHLQGAYGDPY
jgi:hypothetical protein